MCTSTEHRRHSGATDHEALDTDISVEGSPTKSTTGDGRSEPSVVDSPFRLDLAPVGDQEHLLVGRVVYRETVWVGDDPHEL
jgi:hypothetical protein